MSVHFSSKTDDWRTPQKLLATLGQLKPPTFDPCPCPQYPDWVCGVYARGDGLSEAWPTKSHIFINPPYSVLKEGRWTEKIISCGSECTVLVPARTDTKWWQALAARSSAVLFFRGRLKFHEAKSSAPFPSCLICINHEPDVQVWAKAFGCAVGRFNHETNDESRVRATAARCIR